MVAAGLANGLSNIELQLVTNYSIRRIRRFRRILSIRVILYVEGNMTEETMAIASTKLLSLQVRCYRISWTPRVLSPRWKPQTFFPSSIASPLIDNLYKCILYGRVRLEHLFYEFIGDEAKAGDVILPSMRPNHRITYGRIPQFDYILRISSLINTKHRYIYIYIFTHEYGRRDAIWSDVELSGNLPSKDSSRWMHIIALFLPEFWILPFFFSSLSFPPRVLTFLPLFLFLRIRSFVRSLNFHEDRSFVFIPINEMFLLSIRFFRFFFQTS